MNGHAKQCECGCGEWIPAINKKRQPARFKYGHQHRAFRYEVRECGYETPCWIFSNGDSPGGNGYGRLRRNGRSIPAHRYSYEVRVGPIPEGLELDHLCRNTQCVNPDHLEPVTGAENRRRGVGTKLSKGDVDEIRQLGEIELRSSLARGLTRRSPHWLDAMATRFGVSKRHVSKIVKGQTWRGA